VMMADDEQEQILAWVKVSEVETDYHACDKMKPGSWFQTQSDACQIERVVCFLPRDTYA